MPEPFRGILIEGQAVKLTMLWQPTEHAVLELGQLGRPIVVPYFPKGLLQPGTYVSAVCAEDEKGDLVAVDLITSDYERGPISEEERSTLLRRLGVSPLYRTAPDFSSSPVLASIGNLERELILYLQKHPEKMREMHPDAFEKLIAELMASFGFDVEWTARDKNTAADVIALRTDNRSGLIHNYIIECKRVAERNKVGVEIARALYGAKADERFSSALLVTTSFFQQGVERFAARRWDFELRDFHGLVEWLNGYRPPQDGTLYMEGRRLKLKK
jgi:HJR/Mrr/RecB family endonuclease